MTRSAFPFPPSGFRDAVRIAAGVAGLAAIVLGAAACVSREYNQEEGEGGAEAQAAAASCPGGVKKQTVPAGTNINSIQQARAPSGTKVPSAAFNARSFARPVPRHIKMAHDFFQGNSPITGYPHEGLDYSGVAGQRAEDIQGKPIFAITDGKVAFVLSSCGQGGDLLCGDGWGNHVIIDHGGNVYSRYAHIEPGSLGSIKVGQSVRKGQAIAKVGMSGYTAGPHLHLEIGIMSGGAKVNPCAPTKFSQVFNPWHNLSKVD